jgi:integrase
MRMRRPFGRYACFPPPFGIKCLRTGRTTHRPVAGFHAAFAAPRIDTVRFHVPDGACTGMHRGEALALRWSDFNPAAKTLRIERALERLFTRLPKGWGMTLASCSRSTLRGRRRATSRQPRRPAS